MARSLRESYELLGLPSSASEDEVKRAYKQKARECHPDKNPGDPRATEKFQALRQSYERIVSSSARELGDDDEPFVGGFGSFFHFVMIQEMMRRRMQEAMLARMFQGIFFDDESDDDDGFPFAFSGMPFFPHPRNFESNRRSQRRSFHERPFSAPTARGRSSRSQKREKHARRPAEWPRAYENRAENTDDSQNGTAPKYQPGRPEKATTAESRGNGNKPKTTDLRETASEDQSFESGYGEKDFKEEQQESHKGKEKPNKAQKQKQKGKSPRQMTSSQWQNGRKRKRGRKKRQSPKSSNTSEIQQNKAEEMAGFHSETETREIGDQQFRLQTDSAREGERHSSASEANQEDEA